jgi:hypothetical protein
VNERTFTLERGKRSLVLLFEFIASLSADKRWQVTVAPVKRERSDQQNRALWGCAYEHLRRQTGNDKQDQHDYFCGEYWGWDVSTVMGKKKQKPKRSTTYGFDGERDVITTLQLKDFYEFIQQRAAEQGFDVPDPDPNWWQKESDRVAA